MIIKKFGKHSQLFFNDKYLLYMRGKRVYIYDLKFCTEFKLPRCKMAIFPFYNT
jgi:hypothetical protein